MVKNKIKNVYDIEYGKYDKDIYDREDHPKMSIIEYSEDGQVIYEDYSRLDEFLDKKFIPNNVIYKVIEGNYLEKIYQGHISLKKIISLKLSFLELSHVMNYLQEKNIIVTGKLPNFDEIFSNYINKNHGLLGENTSYIRTYATNNRYLSLNDEETISKLIDYNNPKSDNYKNPKIRKEIIEGNLWYVYSISTKLLKIFNYSNININELESYGYEALIKAIDNFNSSKYNNFFDYAYTSIKRAIKEGLSQMDSKEYKRSEWLYNFYICKSEVENITGEKLKDNYALAYLINDLMYQKGFIINKIKKQDNLNRIMLTIELSLDDYPNVLIEESAYYQEIEDKLEQDYIKNQLNEIYKSLKPNHLIAIKLRFGIDDNKEHTLDEIGEKLNITREGARIITNGALKRIRKNPISNNLNQYY